MAGGNCHQGVRDPETSTRRDEDVGLACPGGETPVLRRGALQEPQRGGADADHTPTRRPGGVDPPSDLGGDLTPFRMHPVLAQVLGLDRKEGARAHVQGHARQVDARSRQAVEELRSEMQTGRRRRHRALPPGVNRLVVAAVTVILAPFGGDVGRQGHFPDPGDGGVEIRPRHGEIQGEFAGLALRRNTGGQVAEPKFVSLGDLLPRPHEGPPGPLGHPLVKRGLHGDVGTRAQPASTQPRRDHPGLVDHQDIAASQQGREAPHRVIRQHASGPHLKQARGVARLRRPEGDTVFRKLEVEVRELHGPG